jgi:hypothetical protein
MHSEKSDSEQTGETSRDDDDSDKPVAGELQFFQPRRIFRPM